MRTTKESEVFPGVHTRRYFLENSLANAAAIFTLTGLAQSGFAQQQVKPAGISQTDKVTWDEFLKQSLPIAQELIGDPTFSLDEYLYRIGSLATRLKDIPDSPLGSYAAVDSRVWFGPSFRGTPFFIIQWRMEPGAVLPPHNHPHASVCTVGYAGEVRLRNFEVIGEAPAYESKKTFQIRETHNEILTPGRINTLSPLRDNIHCFQAGRQEARGIDINTMHGEPAPFSFLNVGKKALDAENQIFEATWSDIDRK